MYVKEFSFEVQETGSSVFSFKDYTPYPAINNFTGGAPLVENDAGRIIVISNDDFNSDFNILKYDNTLGLNPVLLETSLSNEEYDALAVLVPNWILHESSGISFSNGDICVYNGTYYVYEGAGTGISSDPLSDSDWVDLGTQSESDVYAIIIELITINPNHISWDWLKVNLGCNNDTVYEVSCHNARVKIKDTDNTEYIKVYVTEYDDTPLENWNPQTINNDTSLTEMQFDISVEKDQFYIIKVQKYNSSDVQIGDDVYLVYHTYCDFLECYTDIVNSIVCCDCPDDPCDQYQMRMLDSRYKNMLRLQAMFSSILFKVHIESTRYLGIYSMDTERKEMITETQLMLEKINYLVGRCDDCNNSTDDKPCNC